MINTVQLTAKQSGILFYIRNFKARMGHTPSVRQIANQFGISSPNGVASHLKALEKKGIIIRDQYSGEGIRLRKTLQYRGEIA